MIKFFRLASSPDLEKGAGLVHTVCAVLRQSRKPDRLIPSQNLVLSG